MGTPPLRSSAAGFRGLTLTGIALLAALALAGCGDAEQDDDGQNSTAPVEADAEVGTDAEGDADAQEDADGAVDTDDAEDEGQDADAQTTPTGSEVPFAAAELEDLAGNAVGTVSFSELDDRVLIEAEVHDLEAGFRGIALHERGVCEPQSSSEDGVFGDYASSGGHLVGDTEDEMGVVEGEEAPETDLDDLSDPAPTDEPAAVTHPDHAGDLPNLLVNQDRTGWLSLVSDRLTPDDLLSGEGASVILHAAADNHANVPERYTGLGPDAETLTDGDAGSRVACGVVAEQ